jgi:hypothetical protein
MVAATQPHEHEPVGPQDTVGAVLSVLCMVHCLATPFAVASLPALASALGGFHPIILVFVVAVALWAFVPGVRRHKKAEVVIEAVGGVLLLSLAALAFHDQLWADIPLSLAGACLMMLAHWRNRVFQRQACARCAH